MDPVRRLGRPGLRAPRAILAFEGWNDACDAASGAAAYVIGEQDPSPFALIEPEEFYDFQATRPTVEVDEGGTRRLTWPETRFYAIEMPARSADVVVVTGHEPNLRWKTYTRLIAQVLAETDVELVITLGAFIGQVPHTLPVPIIGVATDPDLVERFQLPTSHYEGPTGIVGVMLEACREIGIPAVSLWAATPHYLAANPNPRAMLALVDKASVILDIDVDTAELTKVADEFGTRVDEAMNRSEEFADYVRRLEEGIETTGPALDPSGGQLISEIEEWLRDR
jgi:proteasome assembly chaperone (PAC2) family protein